MTDKASTLPRDEFAAIWNSSGSLDEAAARVRAAVGTPCPRWAVMARAADLRAAGAELKRFPGLVGVAARSGRVE